MADPNGRHNPYKVVVFGSGGVGKSSLTLRFVTNTFSPEYLPTIEDCYRKTCDVDGKTAFLDILDTAGQEDYSALRDQWVREGRAFLLVYSVDTRASFEDIQLFRNRILLVNDGEEAVPMVLVANKVDLEDDRVVSKEEGERMAAEYGDIPFVECSALLGLNCEKAFQLAVREIRKIDDAEPVEQESSGSWGLCNVL